MKKLLSFDIGGTFAKYAIVTQDGQIFDRGKYATENISTIEEFVDKMNLVISKYYEERIYDIGISILGSYDQKGKCNGSTENLPFLKDINLIELLESKFPKAEFRLENDGIAAAMGEYYFGNGKNSTSIVCITLGTGIGCGIVIDGKPIKGHNFKSGEIGYFNYANDGMYAENLYSTKAVLQKAAEIMKVKELDGFQFIKEIEDNNSICIEIFDEWMKELGKIIANVVLLIDPEYVIIGGGISQNEKLVLNKLRESTEKYLPDEYKGKTKFAVAKFDNDAALLGMAMI